MEMPGYFICYPTANLVLRSNYMPADGVYVVDGIQRQRYRGMASVGKHSMEKSHVLKSIFHLIFMVRQSLVYWLDRVRDSIKFDSIDELVQGPTQKDEEIARNWKDGE